MHEAWENGQIAQKEIQSVIENIFIIKILNTTIKELQNFKNTIDKVQDANQKNQDIWNYKFTFTELYYWTYNFNSHYIFLGF